MNINIIIALVAATTILTGGLVIVPAVVQGQNITSEPMNDSNQFLPVNNHNLKCFNFDIRNHTLYFCMLMKLDSPPQIQ